MEGLLSSFLYILSFWDKIFPQKRTANRARRLAVSLLLAMGRKTISRANAVTGRDQVDWSADYRLFSRSEWLSGDLFLPILEISSDLVSDRIIAVGYDDTLVHKTGKKIKGTSWQRDPLSPPFNCNFTWGIKYLQASLLLPLYNHRTSPSPCRAIPIQFIQLWKYGTKKRPLRLIVLAPTPYRRTKNGSLNYRNPAYLLTTDLTSLVHLLIQKYLDRWEIEVNFHEEKGQMGLGQQQLWSDKSIPKAPAFIASIYSALLLSSVLLTNDRRDHKIFNALPKWRNKSTKRPSCFDLLALIRKEILTELLSEVEDYKGGLFEVMRNVIEKSAA